MIGLGLALAGADPAGTRGTRAERVDDFGLVDSEGTFHQLSRYSARRAVVLFVHGNGCPIVRQSVPALRELRAKYADDNFAFLLLNPQIQDTPGEIRAEAAAFDMTDFPILIDRSQLVAESLGVERTAEVFVVDPRTMDLLYHGPIDDRLDYETQKASASERYLDEALAVLRDGGRPERREVPSPGCVVTFASRDQHERQGPSYNDDIVPILERRCVACHTPGGIAPWAMTSHAKIRGWAGMIREVVLTERMPPGQIHPQFEERFADVHRLTVEEEQALVHWIDAGAPFDVEEEGPDRLAEAPPSSDEWALGEPDRVLTLPKQEVPATGALDYVYVPVEIGADEDLWVRALDFRPGERAVLHHLLAFIVPPGVDPQSIRKPGVKRLLVGGYGPGKEVQELPAGTGRLLPAGSSLLVSLHYTPMGRPVTDETRIALYFHDAPPPRRILTGQAGNWKFRIPPHDEDFEVVARSRPFREDVIVYSFTPHMHLRGKRMRYDAVLPDRSRHVLLPVPRFSFDWQMKYVLKQPVPLPKGAVIEAVGAFDNSASNPANPDPEQEVRVGLASWDEMFVGYFNYATVAPYERD